MDQTFSKDQVLQSSQSFIRALKSSTDPPHENGPTKIRIARMGWDSRTLYVPRKAGLILDWIFTRFHKEKSRRGHENSLLDIDHWSLLADIVACPGDTQIEPIIHRASIPALIASFVTLYPTIPPDTRSLLSSLLRALNVLWPLAVRRTGLDALAECFWSSLPVLDQLSNDTDNDGLIGILTFVFTGFRAALGNANAAGRKKAYNAISQHQFIPWLRALHLIPPMHALHHLLYSAGTDILYNPESFRTVLESNPRAKSNGDLFSTLFGPSTTRDSTVQNSLLRVLPRLYTDYVFALHKQRSSIFPGIQTGQQIRDRIRHATLRFGDECLAYLKTIEGEVMQASVWETTANVLRVIEKEATFDLAESGPHITTMTDVGEDALRHLDRAWDESQSQLATHALDVHSWLWRIQPMLGVQFLPQVLERLVRASPALNCPVMTFLNELTSYHSKTRTLHTLISHLLSALTSSSPFVSSSDTQTTYLQCARSPLLSLACLDGLTSALHTFVTPGQADEVEQLVTKALKAFLRPHEATQGPEPKRRKVSSENGRCRLVGGVRDSGPDVIKFALVARLGSIALRAVLPTWGGKDAAEREKALLSSLDELISDALLTAFHMDSGAGNGNDKVRRKRSRGDTDDIRWTRECLGSAILRLWYELFAGRRLSCGNMEADVNWAAATTLDHLGDTFKDCMREDRLPELQLEVGRVMFALRAAIIAPELQLVTQKEWSAFDTILDYVEENLFSGGVRPSDIKTYHSQSPHFTRPLAALGLWSLMLERYLPTIDLHASQPQLDRFVNMIIRVQVAQLPTGQDQFLSPSVFLQRAFSSASLWEFGNLRISMLSALEKQTSMLGSVDTQKWLSSVCVRKHNLLDALSIVDNMSSIDIKSGVAVYILLHNFPPEYLSRASRISLTTNAMNADILVRAFNPNDEPTSQGGVEWRAIFRSFVVKVVKQFPMKFIEDMAMSPEWMTYLTLSIHGPAKPSQAYIRATLDLLSLIQVTATRGAVKTEGASLINVLNHFLNYNPYLKGNACNEPLGHRSLVQFFNMLIQEYKVSSFQESVLSLLQKLCVSLEAPLRSAIITMVDQPITADFLASESTIEAWQVLLSLKYHFSVEPSIEIFGQRLLAITTHIMRCGESEAIFVPDRFRAIILSLLVIEGLSLPDHDYQPVISIMAAYLFFTTSTMHTETACDASITYASKSFSVTQYERALELIAEGLEDEPTKQAQLITLMRLSTLFLREAPQRTSKLAHDHVSRCLRIFLNRPTFVNCSSTLAMKALDFVQYQCTERAASLNSLDVACILSIMSKLLTGRSEHDERSSPSIFQAIVLVVNALVRLRRDLLGPLLPQLSIVLRQLISVIRGVRPLLGTKQYRIVADTFPKWINPVDPLGDAEGRSLARLLSAFTTKSFVRTHSSDPQKADSLARPFARHAPYVLLSYLQLMNHPLSVLLTSIRRELEPGLFELCAMMGENGRDTLMAQSLDIGGKTLLKSLWKEYDRQKYIGRG